MELLSPLSVARVLELLALPGILVSWLGAANVRSVPMIGAFVLGVAATVVLIRPALSRTQCHAYAVVALVQIVAVIVGTEGGPGSAGPVTFGVLVGVFLAIFLGLRELDRPRAAARRCGGCVTGPRQRSTRRHPDRSGHRRPVDARRGDRRPVDLLGQEPVDGRSGTPGCPTPSSSPSGWGGTDTNPWRSPPSCSEVSTRLAKRSGIRSARSSSGVRWRTSAR
ncbi:MAG: hypothetical protein R2705_23615 [Ilumatobacteraceae bacterium]